MSDLRRLIVTPLDAAGSWIRQRSIVQKLALFVGLLVAITLGSLITVVSYHTAAMLRDQVDKRLSTLSDDRRALLVSGLSHVQERIRTFGGRYRLMELLENLPGKEAGSARALANVERTLDDIRASAEGVPAVWIEDPEGTRIVSSGPRDLLDLFASDTSSRPLQNRSETALIRLPRLTTQTPVALFQTPARARTKGVVGRLLLVVDLGDLIAEVSDLNGLGETGEIVAGIPDQDTVTCLFPPRFTPSEMRIPVKDSLLLRRALAGQAGFMRTRDRMGRSVLAAYQPVGYDDWVLVVKMEVREAYRPVVRLQQVLLMLGGVILALGLAASYLLAHRLARPVQRLAVAADAIAQGDLETRVDVAPGDEFGTLGLAFTRMTDQLIRSRVELQERIMERTKDLEATRDLLDSFFQIFTSRLDPHNIDRTFDSVLRFCHQLGYDLAMISLVDHDAKLIRGVRGAGTMSDVVGLTIRPLEGEDILAVVAREGRTTVIADSTRDPRCDPDAVALARIHGQIVLPLLGDGSPVLGTLQVATPEILEINHVDLRPLESLASHTARALDALKQVEEIRRLNHSLEEHAAELGKSEASLREHTRILRSVLDCMGEGVVVVDRDGHLLIINPAASRLLGSGIGVDDSGRWSPASNVYASDRLTPLHAEDLPLYRAIHGETVDHTEVYIASPGRQPRSCMLVNARPLRDESDQVDGAVIVFHDITRRKDFECRQAVQYAASRVLAQVDSLNEAGPRILEIIGQGLSWDFGAYWRVDSGIHQLRCVDIWLREEDLFPRFGEATRVSRFPSGEGLPGRVWAAREAIWITEPLSDTGLPRLAVGAEEGLRSGFAAPVMVRGDCLGIFEFHSREPRARDGSLLEMMSNLGTQIGQFIERHQMHTRVVQSEKLASLGMLSAGVAHEINNPLAYIANNLAVLERDLRSLLTLITTYEQAHDVLADHRPELLDAIDHHSEECDLPYIKENLDKILGSTRQGVKRVAEIVQNLRGFARLDRAAVDQLDVHEPIETALEMIRGRLQRRRITVEENHGDLPLISASLVQLNQVFLNLLVNAMQAIESTHRDDGRIVIQTRDVDASVFIEITDNGCGIPADVLPQIFNPFFTTKDVGDGSGLGLSITHGIIQDHGGRLEVESTPGQGTCFRVVLPIARKG